MPAIALKLKRLREYHRYKSESVADHLHISHSTYVRIERGLRPLKVSELLSLSAFYRVDVNTLLADHGEPLLLYAQPGSAAPAAGGDRIKRLLRRCLELVDR